MNLSDSETGGIVKSSSENSDNDDSEPSGEVTYDDDSNSSDDDDNNNKNKKSKNSKNNSRSSAIKERLDRKNLLMEQVYRVIDGISLSYNLGKKILKVCLFLFIIF